MIKTVIATLGSRLGVMAFALGTVLLNTHFQGDHGQGQIALFNLALLVLISLAHFIAGGAVVYLVPRIGAAATWKPAYLWTTAIALLGAGFVELLGIFEAGIGGCLGAMCWFQSLFTYHQSVFLGKERVGHFNKVQLLFAALLFALLGTGYYYSFFLDLWTYVWCAGAAMGLTWLVSLLLVLPHLRAETAVGFGDGFKAIWKFGRWSQLGNVFQNLAYRAPYALMEGLVPGSTAAVGVFSINTYGSEAVWNVGKSLSLVQYSRLSNEAKGDVRFRLTMTFFRLSMLATVPMVLVLVVLPARFWEWILGAGFGPIAEVLAWTGVGILVNAGTMIFSHHFASVGRHKYNALGSAAGCTAILAVGFWRIPSNVLLGAAQAFSAAMLVQAAVATWLFLRLEKCPIKTLFQWKGDLEVLRTAGASAGQSDPKHQ